MIKFLATVAATALASSYAFAPPSYPSAQRHQLVLSAVATNIKGTVKWYNAQRGFGFIEVDDGGPDMYVHATGLTFQGPLIDGERLSFDTEIDPRTNKPKAVAVERVADEEAVAKPEPVSAKEAQVEGAPAKDTPIATVTRTVFDVPKKEKLHVASPPNETFQRSLLAASLANRSASSDPASATAIQSVDYDATARLAYNAAGGSGDFEDFKTKYLADASAMVAEKHKAASAEAAAAAEAARVAKEAEEKRLAEEAAAKEAAAKAEAEAARVAKEAEEKRLAEEAAAKEAAAKAEAEAARLAKEAEEKRLAEEAKAAEEARLAKEAEDAKARELGYPSAAVMKARSQPKSPEDEAALAARYGAMDLEERAFSILADLGMIELHLDPDDPDRDTSHDDDDME
jgi:cold shock CspA family protein